MEWMWASPHLTAVPPVGLFSSLLEKKELRPDPKFCTHRLLDLNTNFLSIISPEEVFYTKIALPCVRP